MKQDVEAYHVYIMASRSRRLYVGVTSDLHRRCYQHKTGTFEGFTSRYAIKLLVYYEQALDSVVAIEREKQIKGWLKKKKLALVERTNPEWRDLSAGWYDSPSKRSFVRLARTQDDSDVRPAPTA